MAEEDAAFGNQEFVELDPADEGEMEAELDAAPEEEKRAAEFEAEAEFGRVIMSGLVPGATCTIVLVSQEDEEGARTRGVARAIHPQEQQRRRSCHHCSKLWSQRCGQGCLQMG